MPVADACMKCGSTEKLSKIRLQKGGRVEEGMACPRHIGFVQGEVTRALSEPEKVEVSGARKGIAGLRRLRRFQEE